MNELEAMKLMLAGQLLFLSSISNANLSFFPAYDK
jgi:hypothetical protein